MGFASLIINTLLVTAVVVIHHEILRLLSTLLPKLEIKNNCRLSPASSAPSEHTS